MAKKKQATNPIEEEKVSSEQSEAMATEPSEASLDVQTIDENAEEALDVEKSTDSNQVESAQISAISDKNESAQAVNDSKPKRTSSTKSGAEKGGKAKTKKTRRSAKYLKIKEKIEPGKLYSVTEAISLIKELSISKFDGSVELHVRLSEKKSKGSTESSKGTLHLPHGTGKDKKIVVLSEEIIETIAKTKKIDFDIAIATPALMPKVARIAKILGPKGKMPDPKSGTVTEDPDEAIKEINSGKVEYRIDAGNNIHQIIGRVSWENDKLSDNLSAVINSLPKTRIASAYISASISPSIPLDILTIK
jgi:large subunit ribosomal protein L1